MESCNPVACVRVADSEDDTELQLDAKLPLEKQCYYHGVLPVCDVSRLLRKNGEFLVIKAEQKEIIAVLHKNKVKYFVPIKKDNLYRSDGQQFSTIPELIIHHFVSENPIVEGEHVPLGCPRRVEFWFLAHEQVTLEKKIDSGNFGDVYEGRLRANEVETKVAIKLARDTTADIDKAAFVAEAKLLLEYNSPFIVKLFGIAATREPLMIVMEYLEGGSLLEHIRVKRRARKPIAIRQKLKWCSMIARGMIYLEYKQCVHCDLAARNCLMTGNKYIKIADFGLAQISVNKRGVRGHEDAIPVRWTAPEVFTDFTFTHKSDVWSYGVLMYELFSDGYMPYSFLFDNEEVMEHVRAGKTLEIPNCVPTAIRNLMKTCWKPIPEQRPTFDKVRSIVEAELNIDGRNKRSRKETSAVSGGKKSSQS